MIFHSGIYINTSLGTQLCPQFFFIKVILLNWELKNQDETFPCFYQVTLSKYDLWSGI